MVLASAQACRFALIAVYTVRYVDSRAPCLTSRLVPCSALWSTPQPETVVTVEEGHLKKWAITEAGAEVRVAKARAAGAKWVQV